MCALCGNRSSRIDIQASVEAKRQVPGRVQTVQAPTLKGLAFLAFAFVGGHLRNQAQGSPHELSSKAVSASAPNCT